MSNKPPFPLHESVVDRIDPEYKAFYNKYIFDKQQVHLQPVAASRTGDDLIPGSGPLQTVASTVDYSFPRKESAGPDVRVRCFTPEGEKPAAGWPVCIYFHGGGWVLGGISTENVIASHLCARGKSIVVAVDYRCVYTLRIGSDSRVLKTNKTRPRKSLPCSGARCMGGSCLGAQPRE